jgi:hypothetical protein
MQLTWTSHFENSSEVAFSLGKILDLGLSVGLVRLHFGAHIAENIYYLIR